MRIFTIKRNFDLKKISHNLTLELLTFSFDMRIQRYNALRYIEL
jgi:hypothetical protein